MGHLDHKCPASFSPEEEIFDKRNAVYLYMVDLYSGAV